MGDNSHSLLSFVKLHVHVYNYYCWYVGVVKVEIVWEGLMSQSQSLAGNLGNDGGVSSKLGLANDGGESDII